ncbi:MAG TPA: hypothetical protein H9714_04765 [Candidatus Flavonifractor intestinipullorum]|uniref:Uncharacterized protein n=1 Tax=Candidatus Flavonifractor intestinipullorum TaxID=2838587 RepID=A0A9D2S4X6_9FIRM|nr:hypothetical protein [Candidatus Flavonifractor intestinipullorum]
MKKRSWKDTFMMVWDVLFVLILCFVILLTTMLVTQSGGESEFTGYTIHPLLLLGVIVAVGGYLCFMVKVSLGMLRRLIEGYFRKDRPSEHEKEGK